MMEHGALHHIVDQVVEHQMDVQQNDDVQQQVMEQHVRHIVHHR